MERSLIVKKSNDFLTKMLLRRSPLYVETILEGIGGGYKMKTIIDELDSDRAEWILSLADVLRESCPNLTLALPEIRMDLWTVYANMAHSLQLVAMSYDIQMDVGAREYLGEFIPLVITDDDPEIWNHVTRIALEAKASAEQMLAYHDAQAELENVSSVESSVRGMRA